MGLTIVIYDCFYRPYSGSSVDKSKMAAWIRARGILRHAGQLPSFRSDHKSIQSVSLSYRSSALDPPTPSPARECCPCPLGALRERHTRLRGRGWGPNSEEDTLLLYAFVYYNPQRTYIYRVPQCMGPRLNWDSPTPSLAGECATSPGTKGGWHSRLRVRGWGSPNSDDWRKA